MKKIFFFVLYFSENFEVSTYIKCLSLLHYFITDVSMGTTHCARARACVCGEGGGERNNEKKKFFEKKIHIFFSKKF